MLTWSEVRPILRTVLRWWWVVVCAVVLSVGTAFVISAREQRYYTSRASLMIGTSFSSTLPDPLQLQISGSLVRYYGELARRQPILERVVTRLNLPFQWFVISDVMLRTSTISSANLLEIEITDSNPDRAAAIANAIGDELIAYSPAAPDKVAATQAEVERQIAASELRIQELKSSIDELDARQAQLSSAAEIAEASSRLSELQRTLQEEETNYQSLFRLRGSSIANSLSFFEAAEPATQPLPTRRAVTLGIAGVAGLLLSLLAVFLLDRVDRRWHTPAEVEERLNIRSLGSVPDGEPLLLGGAAGQMREMALRETHTNLLLATADTRLHTLLVASPSDSINRAAYSADLAYLFARSGYRVLLVDADIDHATLTALLGTGGAINWNGFASEDRTGVWTHIRATTMPNLMILPGRRSGQAMPTLVPSLRWPDLVRQLAKVVDITIFDGAPALGSADSALLAPYVDGVVVTLDPRVDTRDHVARTRERLMNNPTVRLAGAVTFTAMPGEQPSSRLRLPTFATPLLPAPTASATDAAPIVTPAADAPVEGEIVADDAPAGTPLITPLQPQAPAGQAEAADMELEVAAPPASANGARRKSGGRRSRTSTSRQRRADS